MVLQSRTLATLPRELPPLEVYDRKCDILNGNTENRFLKRGLIPINFEMIIFKVSSSMNSRKSKLLSKQF